MRCFIYQSQIWSQADVSYHVPKVMEEPSFNLTVDIRRHDDMPAFMRMRTEAGGELCGPLEVHICARWLKPGASNMAIIKVKLVSGFKADEESLDNVRTTSLSLLCRRANARNVSYTNLTKPHTTYHTSKLVDHTIICCSGHKQ